MKKNVLIVGPIGDFGGREVEVNIIAKAIEETSNVTIFSTGYMTQNSFALKDLHEVRWKSVNKEIYDASVAIRFFSFFSKLLNRKKLQTYAFSENSITTKFFDFNARYWYFLKEEIKKNAVVFLCMQLTSDYLKEIVEFCYENNIPCYVRTTGTIKKIDIQKFEFLKKVTLFVHHSERNAHLLNSQIQLPYTIIDQCALNEETLLKIDPKLHKPICFGFLGRLSDEKGILPIANFFSNSSLPFIIAGDGNQKEELLEIISDKPNCKFLGSLKNENLALFFDEIDVLIIPSYEESGPLVALEAMAAGKIIISTKVGAMEERLEGLRSFWFQIENLSSLQLAVTQVLSLNETERVVLSNSLRQRYLRQYSFQTISERYKVVIKKI